MEMEVENERWKNGNGKLAGNALLLSIHSMDLDVRNYAKVNEKHSLLDDGAMWIGNNARWLNDC